MATDTKDDEYAEMRIVTVIVRLGWGAQNAATIHSSEHGMLTKMLNWDSL